MDFKFLEVRKLCMFFNAGQYFAKSVFHIDFSSNLFKGQAEYMMLMFWSFVIFI